MQSGTTTGDDSLVPPKELLFDGSSTPEEFILLGENFVRYILIQRAFLPPDAAFLDLGCGNGAVARALTGYLTAAGRYEGLDINLQSVSWLQEQYSRFPNFGFRHTDVYNKMYNPAGTCAAHEYELPFGSASFDMVLLKSVFTHMLPRDVQRYVGEVSRVLKPGGRAVITYFLLNDESRRFIDRGVDTMGLRFDYAGDPLCRVANPDVPEAVVAHDESRIRALYSEKGLSLQEVTYGNWCGRPALMGLQDFTIAIRM